MKRLEQAIDKSRAEGAADLTIFWRIFNAPIIFLAIPDVKRLATFWSPLCG